MDLNALALANPTCSWFQVTNTFMRIRDRAKRKEGREVDEEECIIRRVYRVTHSSDPQILSSLMHIITYCSVSHGRYVP